MHSSHSNRKTLFILVETNRDSVNFSCSSISEVTELGFIESNSDLLNVKFCLSQPHFYKAKGYMKIQEYRSVEGLQQSSRIVLQAQSMLVGTKHQTRGDKLGGMQATL